MGMCICPELAPQRKHIFLTTILKQQNNLYVLPYLPTHGLQLNKLTSRKLLPRRLTHPSKNSRSVIALPLQSFDQSCEALAMASL